MFINLILSTSTPLPWKQDAVVPHVRQVFDFIYHLHGPINCETHSHRCRQDYGTLFMFCVHSKDAEMTRNKCGAHRWNTWGGTVRTTLQSSEECLILKMMWRLWFCPRQQNPAYNSVNSVHQINRSERAAGGGARTRLKAEARSPECFFLRMSSFHTQKIQRTTSSRAAEKLPNKMNL